MVTTTTANAAAVLEHMEFQLQSACPHLDVLISDVTDEWAQFAVAGPRAREVIAAALVPASTSPTRPSRSWPPRRMELAGIPGRIFRISFSGELAYEVAVPARHATSAWPALLRAGEPYGLRPYGLDALNTLRIEKGHVTGAELNGNTSAADLGFGRMLKKTGDFVGRTLAQRAGMCAAERLQLVGIRPVDRARRLRNGMHLVEPAAPRQQPGLHHLLDAGDRARAAGWDWRCSAAAGTHLGGACSAAPPIHGESS